MLQKQSGVYAITCTVNGHRYIGSSKDIRQRWASHKSKLRKGKSECLILQNAWNKYGENTFEFSILELVPILTNLTLVEQQYMDILKPEYNARIVAWSRLGMTNNPLSVAKMRASLTGLKRTAEQGRHIGDGRRGFKCSPEQIEHIRKGATNPPEAQRQKMRAAKLGIAPLKAIEASVKARTGKPRSEVTIQRIKETKLRNFQLRREQGLPALPPHERDDKGRFI